MWEVWEVWGVWGVWGDGSIILSAWCAFPKRSQHSARKLTVTRGLTACDLPPSEELR
ncbi:MAG: hypothetical protein F6K24_41570 [Okeania sp. SIO2D1]|nr:hypothetical protein [Okeania sp. SIO2D1]